MRSEKSAGTYAEEEQRLIKDVIPDRNKFKHLNVNSENPISPVHTE